MNDLSDYLKLTKKLDKDLRDIVGLAIAARKSIYTFDCTDALSELIKRANEAIKLNQNMID